MNLKLLLFTFAAFGLASLANASNPYHDLAREQMWDTTHIFVWGVAGGMISSVLFLCALIFSCANYFCVAQPRRRATVSDYEFAENSSESTTRTRLASILLTVSLVFFSISLATACVAFNAQMSIDNDLLINFVEDSSITFQSLTDSNTCQNLANYQETQSIQSDCFRVSNTVSNISHGTQNFLMSWDLFFSQTIMSVYVAMGIFVFFATLAGCGACLRIAFLVRIFAVLALFFASFFVFLWMLYGLPINLVHHNCNMVHKSFASNNSDLFPGMPLIALTYNLTDGFQDWDNFNRDLNRDLNHPNRVNFTALVSQQEQVFQMVRSCLWDGITLNSTLDVFNLRQPLELLLSQSMNLVVRLNQNLNPYDLQLPSNMTEEFDSIKWGRHSYDENSQSTLEEVRNQIYAFQAILEQNRQRIKKTIYTNVTSDLHILLLQTTLLNDFIALSDCRSYKEFYRGINEIMCESFALDVENAAWSFGTLGFLTVFLFFFAFYTGYRLLASRTCPSSIDDQEAQRTTLKGDQINANAPLLSEEKAAPYYYKPPAGYSYYGTTGPVSYNPAPPLYNPTLNSSELSKL